VHIVERQILVIRRVGGLEVTKLSHNGIFAVIRRVGGLEAITSSMMRSLSAV